MAEATANIPWVTVGMIGGCRSWFSWSPCNKSGDRDDEVVQDPVQFGGFSEPPMSKPARHCSRWERLEMSSRAVTVWRKNDFALQRRGFGCAYL